MAKLEFGIPQARFRQAIETAKAASPFLRSIMLRRKDLLEQIAQTEPDCWENSLLNTLKDAANLNQHKASPAEQVMRIKSTIRQIRQEHLLGLAIIDICAQWPLARVTASLSKIAAAALDLSISTALRSNALRRGMDHNQCDQLIPSCGFCAIGMGKLGAGELNYSSDLDLVMIYSPENEFFHNSRSPADEAVRITRQMIDIVQGVTADGNGWRIDLRLRPDPGATQLAVAKGAAENYYASMALTWERAAYIKARAVAGDIANGEDFLQAISPFVWRRALDYTAIDELRSLKRRIDPTSISDTIFPGTIQSIRADQQGADALVHLCGYDIKRGRGGIRDIEFFAQAQQLVAAGRTPSLRVRGTVEALEQLAALGWISDEVRDVLSRIYPFFRRVEHALQMINDAQTHKLPANEVEWVAVASLLPDHESAAELALSIEQARNIVAGHYDALFEPTTSETSQPITDTQSEKLTRKTPQTLRISSNESDQHTSSTLAQHGFPDPEGAYNIIRNWHYGRYPATRTDRGRGMLTAITPRLLEAFAQAQDPNQALSCFDQFVKGLPAGIQVFSLLNSNKWLINTLTDICSAAPEQAKYLAKRPHVLDALIDPSYANSDLSAHNLRLAIEAETSKATDLEGMLDATRIVAHENRFRIAVRTLTGEDEISASQTKYSDLASEIIRASAEQTWNLIWNDLPPRGENYAIVAYGRLGTNEMTPSSDLDLVVVYESTEIDAPKRYHRFTTKLISALTAQTAQGSLYDVDTRLRPSGRSGAIAASLEAYADYNENSAWVWEIMALLRARVVCSSCSEFATRLRNHIDYVISVPRDHQTILQGASSMRERLMRDKPQSGPWDVKAGRGGLTDLYLVLQSHVLSSNGVVERLLAHRDTAGSGSITTSSLIDALNLPHISEPISSSATNNFGDNSIHEAWECLNSFAHLSSLCLSDLKNDLPAAFIQRFAKLLKSAKQSSSEIDANYLLQRLESTRELIARIADERLGNTNSANALN